VSLPGKQRGEVKGKVKKEIWDLETLWRAMKNCNVDVNGKVDQK
jgi:hypothetical protein